MDERKILAVLGILLFLATLEGVKIVIDRRTLRKIQERYGSLIRKYASLYGVPEDLIVGIIYVESRGNPRALSPVGAAGLMQVWWPAALEVGEIKSKEEWKPERFFDPDRNIRTGTAYLAYLRDFYYRKRGFFPSIQTWARMYYGGPDGYRQPNTERYGRTVARIVETLRQPA